MAPSASSLTAIGGQGRKRPDDAGLLQAWMDVTRNGLLLIDGQGLAQWANAVATQWLGREPVGEAWERLWPDADHAALQAALAAAWQGTALTFASTVPLTGAVTGTSSDVSAAPMRDGNGHVSSVLLVVHTPLPDPSIERLGLAAAAVVPASVLAAVAPPALAASEAQALGLVARRLARAERLRMLGQLVAGLAHDLSNVLNVVTNSSSLIRTRGNLDTAQERAVQAIDRAMRLGTTLLRRLLDGARMEPASQAPLRLDDLLREHAGLLGPLLGEHIRLRVEMPEPAWPVKADAQAIVSVLMNLLANARDAVGPLGGEVELCVCNVPEATRPASLPARDHVCLRVRDNGCGIPADVLQRLGHEPFVTTKPAGQGTGLGLTSAFDLARSCGGDVQIVSTPGIGTTVSLYLPRALQDRDPSPS